MFYTLPFFSTNLLLKTVNTSLLGVLMGMAALLILLLTLLASAYNQRANVQVLKEETLQGSIQKRKRAEEALHLAEANYRSIFENAIEGIFQTAPDGRFITERKRVEERLGESRRQFEAIFNQAFQFMGLLTPDDRHLIDIYLEESPLHIEAMNAAVTQNDAAVLKQATHTLKSTSAALGAIALSKLCEELEAIGQAGTITDAPSLVSQLAAEYERVKVALQRERQPTEPEIKAQ